MSRPLRQRPRLFRALLLAAMTAWLAFALQAIAGPAGMIDATPTLAHTPSPAMQSGHCEDMAPLLAASPDSNPAPSTPLAAGHGCCTAGHCDCVASCGSIAMPPLLAMAWPPLRDPLLVPMHADVLQATATPQLRPPIA